MPKPRSPLAIARSIPLVGRLLRRPGSLARGRASARSRWLRLDEARGTGDFSCTACREERALAPFEQRADASGVVYDLWICLNCLAILNATHLRAIRQGADFLSWQSDSSDEFYAVDDAYLATVPEAIEGCGFIDFLLSVYPRQARGVLLDFGAGRGIIAGAAAKYFDKVYAAELSLNVLRQVHAVMPARDRIVITDDYLAIEDGLDAVVSMHVLEHLPNMRDILETLVERMNPGGSLLFQVPMLRNDYLVNVHYTFFTETSARSLCRDLGLQTVGVWFDHALDFLACIARKPLRSAIKF